jgi:hypothetical protein
LFFIGSNADGETVPAYILAGDCSITTPTTLASIGYPASNIIMNVIGHECTASYNTISEEVCEEYVSPSGKIWNETGLYHDTISNATGCDSVLTINLVVHKIDTLIVQVDNYLVSAENSAIYEWVNCSNSQTLDGEVGQIFIAENAGDYSLRISKEICVYESDCYTITPSAVDIDKVSLEMKLFPNPAHDVLYIETPLFVQGMTYKIINTKSIQVLKGQILLAKEEISIGKLNAGQYFIQICSGGDCKTLSFMKE